jgi:hypothetical protein
VKTRKGLGEGLAYCCLACMMHLAGASGWRRIVSLKILILMNTWSITWLAKTKLHAHSRTSDSSSSAA